MTPQDEAPTDAADARNQRVLRERAAALARHGAETDAQDDDLELITFALADQICALPLSSVREVFRPRDLAVLPGAEPPAYAVTPWRGVLLTVLDLRAALGAHSGGITDLNHVIAVGVERASVGILIDRVLGIESTRESLLLAPTRADGDSARLLRAVTRNAVLVLDATALLENFG